MTIDAIRQLQSFLHKIVVKFNLYEAVTFFIRPGQVGFRLFEAGSWLSQDNIFHINTLSWDEKRPALLNFSLRDMLARLTFLRSSSPELLEKKIYPKVYEHIKISEREFTAAKEKKLLKMISPECGFLRTLLARQQYIQNNPDNLREADCKKGSEWLLFENIRVFDFTKYLNL